MAKNINKINDPKALTFYELDKAISDSESTERIKEKLPYLEEAASNNEIDNNKEKQKDIKLNNSNNKKANEMKKQKPEKEEEYIPNQNNISNLGCSKNHGTIKSNSNSDEKSNKMNSNKDYNINNTNKNNKISEISLRNKYVNNKISERNSININVKQSPKYMNKNISSRLNYSKSIYYVILFLNIFLPGIGTIIAAIGWGNSSNSSNYKNRTKELIIRGVIQFLTFIFLVGWVQAIFDACHYFEIKSY